MDDEDGYASTGSTEDDALAAWAHDQTRESAYAVGELVGERVRALRHAYDVRQERVAEVAREVGLTWARTSVATLEAGRRDLGIDELALLPLILSRACGRPLGLAALIPDAAQVRVGSVLVDGSTLRLLLGGSGDVASALARLPEPSPGRDADPDAESDPRWRDLTLRWPELGLRSLVLARKRAGQEADLKAAKKLGVPVEYVAVAAQARWGRSLTAERDDRAAIAGLPTTPRGRQTTLGNTTRKLLAELSDELAAAEDRAQKREH